MTHLWVRAEQRDHETGNHVLRVGRVAGIIASQLGLSDTRAHLVGQAAILHDVGKIGISDTILLKPDRLTEEEMHVMKRHRRIGAEIVRSSFGSPKLAHLPVHSASVA